MGISCSSSREEVKDTDAVTPRKRLLSKRRSSSVTGGRVTGFSRTMSRDGDKDRTAARRLIDAHDTDISSNLSVPPPPPSRRWRSVGEAIDAGFATTGDYFLARHQILSQEKTLDFDFRCRVRATDLEKSVDAIIQRLKTNDVINVYDAAERREGFGGQEHKRFPGDHFLSNVDLIDKTALFDVAKRMPKGGHLHIHFNACLRPHVLLDIAKEMGRMCITSDLPLVPDDDYANYEKCEIQFSLRSPDDQEPEDDLFSRAYRSRRAMKLSEFLKRFPHEYGKGQGSEADEWLLGKLVFQDEEAHNRFQTASGAWEKFNGRTRMMKGLFNYETAYRRYTRLFLENLLINNIQYAEIRPNFMTSNQLFPDDGTKPIDNWGIMAIIIDEVGKFTERVRLAGQPQKGSPPSFSGLKVIYCTPRSFSPDKVKAGLDECIAFKERWPEWIAGFDLVGEEAKGRPLKDFIEPFLQFKKDCRAKGLDIPFLFHCGETLDMGTDTDQNLVDALLLDAKRIGHGFALAKHPYIMQHMKARGVCLELCPISNEVLGLTPRVSGHTMYELLANNVHCTVSSDNGTLFR